MEEAGEGSQWGMGSQRGRGLYYHQWWVTKKEELCKGVGWIAIQPIRFIINKLMINFNREVENV